MKNKKLSKIIYSSGLVLLSLVSCISATFSWFNTRRTVSAQLSGFEVSLPPSQTADLYYLAKNKNEKLNVFSGYERSSLSEKDYTNFIKISESDSSDASPTNTQLLWPNHELTFALVFTPIQTGAFTFSLDSWESKESEDKKVKTNDGNEEGIRLAWAINVYCTNSEHKIGFTEAMDYFKKFESTDLFGKGENVLDPLSNIQVTDASKEIAVYFTIRYSNDSSTYYLKNEDGYYENNPNSSEQSNCYEDLTFKVSKFSLKLPGGEQ